MKKWLFFGLMICALVITGLAVGRFFIPIEVKNLTGDSRMKPSKLLANLFLLKEGYSGKITKIDITYTDEVQNRHLLYNSRDGILVQNFGLNFENGVLTILVYYNPVKRDEILIQKGWVNRDIWTLMCFVVENKYDFSCNKKAADFSIWSKKWLRFTLVQQAYAYCKGTITCKRFTSACACPNGVSCTGAGTPCSTGGSCTCTNNFCETTMNLDCGVKTTKSSCEGVTQLSCGSGNNCGPDATCEWVCEPSCTNYCGTKADGCGGTCSCVECGPDWGAWSACNDNHKSSRTATYNCRADSTQTRDCIGTLQGTPFDASDFSSCPGDIGTNAVYTPLRIKNQEFSITGTWPVISTPVSTDAEGNYSESVYASETLPATYTIDFSNLITAGLVAGVKLECEPPIQTITHNAEIVTKNIGFWRVYGGWWQVVGGSVYAGTGMKSEVPASMDPAANQKLILADANGRSGVLAHGTTWTGLELGTNPAVSVSTPLWRIESLYGGLRYDYNYYNTRMNILPSTEWDGGAIAYDEGGNGYQILKHTGDVTLNSLTLSGTQKIILLVDGNVSVTGDIIVPDGVFLAVIAKGNITINYNVAKVQGWFVAENINAPCHDGNSDGDCDRDDIQFEGQGSFVGWSAINLRRDRFTTNNQEPSEKFVYRADFVLSAPAPIRMYTRKFTPFIP